MIPHKYFASPTFSVDPAAELFADYGDVNSCSSKILAKSWPVFFDQFGADDSKSTEILGKVFALF